jgi:hypothetical protein
MQQDTPHNRISKDRRVGIRWKQRIAEGGREAVRDDDDVIR